MESSRQTITPEAEALVQQHGGPLTVAGQQGDLVLMRSDVYIAMLGLGDNDEAETLAAVRRGLADVDSGRTQDLDEAFDELDSRHES